MKTLLAMFGFKTKTKAQVAFKKYMRLARTMLEVARKDKADGFPLAAKAALDSAMSYRAAAHASIAQGA